MARHENPTDQQVLKLGAGMEALGMSEHQYLAAVHRDTDNIHGHFMVNRIHPETYRPCVSRPRLLQAVTRLCGR